MAKMTEFETMRRPLILLQSKEEVQQQILQNKDKLLVILFNSSEVQRNSIEHPFKDQRTKYQDSSDILFFKCIVLQTSDELASEFKIKTIPTIVFYRNEKESCRLVKPTVDQLLTELGKLKKKENS